MKVIIFLGPPGSGKGTQARLLSRDLNVDLVGMGDLLREEIQKKTKEGSLVEQAVDNGEMPDWSVVRTIFEKCLNALKCPMIIFDGIPRNECQAHDVEDILSRVGALVMGVIFLDVPHSVLIHRMFNRLQCAQCGMSYAHRSLQDKMYCNFCGGTHFIKRKDDAEQIIRKRLELYDATVAPLIEYYKSRNILTVVDGTLSVPQVQNRIMSCLGLSRACHQLD